MTAIAAGLRVTKAPEFVYPESPYRWLLTHHEGAILSAFETKDAADRAAEQVAPLADWTKSVMTAAQEISLSLPGGATRFLALLKEFGGHDINQPTN